MGQGLQPFQGSTYTLPLYPMTPASQDLFEPNFLLLVYKNNSFVTYVFPNWTGLSHPWLFFCLSHSSSQTVVTQPCQDREIEVPSIRSGTSQGLDDLKEHIDVVPYDSGLCH